MMRLRSCWNSRSRLCRSVKNHESSTVVAIPSDLDPKAQRLRDEDPESTVVVGGRSVCREIATKMAGRYRILDVIGSGGGGTVYRGRHESTGEMVAVKVLRRDLAVNRSMVARFCQEARAVGLIGHPNIVKIFEFGEVGDGRPYYAMELLKGKTLRSIILQDGRISADEMLIMMEQIGAAVDAAHQAKIVHRDLKAGNIIIDGRGEDLFVKLLDFGVAKLLQPQPGEQGLTRAGVLVGTTIAMSPEQIRSQTIDHRADIYGLGVLIYQMLTGGFPFYSEFSPELLRMHLEDPPPRASQNAPISPALDAIVTRAMQKRAEDRYQSVGELLEALRSVVKKGTTKKLPKTPIARVIAIHIESKVAENGQKDHNDELLDDLMEIQDIASRVLKTTSFAPALTTSVALMGVSVLRVSENLSDRCKATLALAHSIAQELQSRPTAHPNVEVRISLHVGEGELSRNGDKVCEGEVFDLLKWLPKYESTEMVRSSPEFRNAMFG